MAGPKRGRGERVRAPEAEQAVVVGQIRTTEAGHSALAVPLLVRPPPSHWRKWPGCGWQEESCSTGVCLHHGEGQGHLPGGYQDWSPQDKVT